MADKKTTPTLIDNIKVLINNSFHGGAWHGPSVLEVTKGLGLKQASYSTGSTHTIAELVYHITSWRIFTIKKIQGDADYNIDDEKKNWGNLAHIDQFELETLMMELTLSHDELMKELEEKTDDFLTQIVPGAEYDFFTLFTGLINHDLYHAGQISLLKKLSAKVKSSSYDDEMSSSRYFEDDLDNDFV
ncbi:MAG: DinB family protein [Leadbetterella sp.]